MTKVKWKTRNGEECTGELHSFVHVPNQGITAVVITVLADGNHGFFPVDMWELSVVEKKKAPKA